MPGAEPADPAEQLDDEHQDPQPNGDQPAAEPTAESVVADDKTPDGELSPAARPKEKAEPAGTDGDDVVEENDPLTKLRKQFVAGESPTPPVAAKPAAKPEPEPGKPDTAAKAEPAKAAPKNEPTRVDDDPELADLPKEDWSKLSHDGKRQFLTQRKEVVNLRKQRDELTAKEKAALQREQAAKTEAERTARFVAEQGLDNEEFGFGVQLMGAIKRNDPRAIPAVENTLRELLKANGKQFPEPATAQQPEIEPIKGKLPDDLAELVELHGVPEEEMRLLAALRVQKAQRKAQPAPPAAPPAPVAPIQPAAPANGQRQPDAAEVAVNRAIYSYLEGQGVPRDQVLAYVEKQLLPLIPEPGKISLQDRLAAVVSAHSKRVAANPPKPAAQRTPSPQPISGRNGAAGVGRTTTADPLQGLKAQWVR